MTVWSSERIRNILWSSLWSSSVREARFIYFYVHCFSPHHMFPNLSSMDFHEESFVIVSSRPRNIRDSFCLLPLAHTSFIWLLRTSIFDSLLPNTKPDFSYGSVFFNGSVFPRAGLLGFGLHFRAWNQRCSFIY